MKYYLGIGSNRGERRENLLRCHAALNRVGARIIKYSSVYETQPVGDLDQPWFLNQVVEIDSELEPDELLNTIKQIEREMGRNPIQSDKPRSMDIDILLAENRIVHTPELQIPHPRLHERNFVLVPLKEIAPDIMHPILKLGIKAILANSQNRSQVKLYKRPDFTTNIP